jgi:4-aminobutyrate aminotransferase/(S)-3-amino-2-methylpropionate transaminase
MLEALRREDGPGLSARLGAELATELDPLAGIAGVHEVRGIGSLWGIELVTARSEADAARAFDIVRRCLQRGVLVLADGSERNVLALMPPFVLDRAQREAAIGVLRQALLETAPQGSS